MTCCKQQYNADAGGQYCFFHGDYEVGVCRLLCEKSSGGRDDDVAQHLVVHAVLAVEVEHIDEMLSKLLLAVHKRVAVGKEAPAVVAALIRFVGKQLLLHLLEVLEQNAHFPQIYFGQNARFPQIFGG